ncbi:MAG: DUF3078 domain-containing protein [Saprospiraceae bacterium]|nr:DUF3078 domain-containing protein [Saprospiraceae bacterium]MBP7800779.1 DUF3078 domain-containing protein [Saprospiraceae bacterium]MBP8096992.1 DUF3078 domain-containing protein [Saprospiraceae bacterium]
MMKRILFLFLVLIAYSLSGQNDDGARAAAVLKAAEKEIKEDGWISGGGFGMDMGQLLQINPKVGGGENRLGFGGAISIFAKYKKGLLSFDNIGSFNMGLVKLGTGILASTASFAKVKQPFLKSIDELRLGSRLGYKTGETSKWSYAVDFGFISQLMPTYRGTDNKNYVKQFRTSEIQTNLVSKLFAPAYITLAPGIDYKPNDKISWFFAPFGYKSVIVADRDLARLNIHGNKWTSNEDFKLTDSQLGGMIKGNYTNKYLDGRINHSSGLTLFSNYLNEPNHIDVDWLNEFGFNIYKGFQISLLTDVFYDHDVKVQITDYSEIGGVRGTGRRVSFTEQLLVKYNMIF